ncbi:D-alanyl-D-alanine-carboxypeptidase/endopeptidase AmpH [Pelagibacterium flavum]|uniref:D-alanyl-D-alanine-carboxypeptidase/endopeptidase AmpH n=1 Tax=Pelagibacterium flavum TaxID=2984530 RepID=A0ABY6IQ65_9HYPH|nr:D-alanyl-D-alanine-carboxypeptidase/endopeptidase AmpH [Pelagibacterium sp. YIM 151497]UYQ72611.1 D-alanyl-D-alanine-carboxypeptidase/endopeptidase AmpH [Pelagibacterium sp. YIM 151497]|tara:strand:- start:5086 stop:6195 length:1110 start_codon:yes stop_codon:yes gene_type:complete
MKHVLAAATAALLVAAPAFANEPLLEEAVGFTGQIFHLETGVPGLVIAAVRDGESAIATFGETGIGSGRQPNGETQIGVGSITKSFTGLALAHAVADGTVALTDPAGPHISLVDTLPERGGRHIRLVDLATHASGFPRELAPAEGVERYSDASFAANLNNDPLLFAPGEGMAYSNIGFDLLAMALSERSDMPYADLLQESVLDPIGLSATGYARPEGENVMTGYDWNDQEMDPGDPISNRFGASQLYTTANDMVKYLSWNLDRFGEEGTEARSISHAAWVMRDGLDPVFGMDESGHMDAMGLGWVIMMPEGDRPLILQKAGGTNGVFSYIAFAPSRGVGVFMSINKFDFAAATAMADVANDLITTLAPR